jgi:membrane-associated protein
VSSLVDKVLALHGLAVYAVVGGLVFAEDALFLGFVVPGETAAVIGGVAASRGNASVVIVCVVVVFAAIIGDTIGFAVGTRYGDRLLHSRALRRRATRMERAEELLRRRGGTAVFIGRFIAFLRSIMPFLAGSSHLRYRRFAVYNAAGGLVWGVGSVLLGYLAGNSYKAIERAVGPVTAIIFAVLVIAGLIAWSVRRHRAQPD